MSVDQVRCILNEPTNTMTFDEWMEQNEEIGDTSVEIDDGLEFILRTVWQAAKRHGESSSSGVADSYSTPRPYRVWDGREMNAVDFRIRPDGTLSHLVYSREAGRVEKNADSESQPTVCDTVEEEAEVGWQRESDLVVMHYSGVDDSENTPIFEDDILICNDANGNEYIGRVQFRRGRFEVVDASQTRPCRSLHSFGVGPTSARIGKVIGNIYQNPDLLEDTG